MKAHGWRTFVSVQDQHLKESGRFKVLQKQPSTLLIGIIGSKLLIVLLAEFTSSFTFYKKH